MNATAARVFVSQDNEFDYSAAELFGAVVFCSTREIVPYTGSASAISVGTGIESEIAGNYIPGIDYLLPSGSVLSIAHMLRAAFAKPGKHKLLKWDRQAQRYFVYTM